MNRPIKGWLIEHKAFLRNSLPYRIQYASTRPQTVHKRYSHKPTGLPSNHQLLNEPSLDSYRSVCRHNCLLCSFEI